MSASEMATVKYFGSIDYCVFTILLLASMAIGIYFGFFSKNLKTAEDYLVGGHRMKIVPVAISLMASQLSATEIVAIPAEIYSFGWQYMLLILALPLVILVINFVALPFFYCNKIVNCYAYLEMRFGKATRKLLTALYILLYLFFMPVMMYIPALAFAEVTMYNTQVVSTIVCSICVIYTMLGGIKAVVWTDVLQASVMIASITLVAILGIHRTGGIAAVWNRAVDGGRIFPPIMTLDLTTRVTFWNTIISVFVIWNCIVSFNQSCAQRLCSLPSLKHARRSMMIFFVGIVAIMAINTGTGIIMYSFYHGCDPIKAGHVSKPDHLLPRFVQDLAGQFIPGMPGIFISCVFSASLSCVSANLHAMSGIIYSDYIRPMKLFKHCDRNANRSMRITIVVLGMMCAGGSVLVENFRSIFQLMGTIGGTVSGAKFGIFTLGMLYPWANQKGAIVGVICSVVTVAAIAASAQIYKQQYTPIPTSIDQCDNDTTRFTWTQHLNETHFATNELNDGFALHTISFQWYPVIGAFMTWIPAIIASYLTGGQDMSKFNIQLLSPIVQRMLPKRYQHTELESASKMSCRKRAANECVEARELTELIQSNDEK